MSGQSGATQTEREAARWIARLEAHDVSLGDHRRFRRWLTAAPQNRPAYEAMSRTWDKLDALKHLDFQIPAQPHQSRRALLAGGAAGALVVAAGGALLFALAQNAQATPYATAIGERSSVTFADGSTAELNADTRMRALIGEHERRIYFESGEALFEVRSDQHRPFIVETSFGEVRAGGTTFLVKIGAEGARATVIHGAVEARGRSGVLAMLTHPQHLVANANQEITFKRAGLETVPLPAQTLERRLAWREGMLAFDGETLREAVLEIERQTGVHFEFADASIGDLRVGGYISATDIAGFTQLLAENLHLKAERRSPNLVQLRRV